MGAIMVSPRTSEELKFLLDLFERLGISAFILSEEDEERFADKFASCLLIPEEPLRIAIGSATQSAGGLKHAELFDIARQFDVSIEARRAMNRMS